MPDRIARRNGVGTVLLAIALLAAIAVAAVLWWKRGPSGPMVQTRIPIRTEAGTLAPLTITAFFPRDGALAAESLSIKRLPDSQSLAREALNAVLSETRTAQMPVLRSLKLRAFYLDGAGTAYVDLAIPGQTGGTTAGSAWDEMLTLYTIVDTLTQNFEEIKQVRFLAEGREAQTLAGHIDLTRAFKQRMDLVRQ